jgi:putative endonuclease
MKSAGVAAEDLALEFLESRGLKLITRNYRCRFGEIDLVLQDGDTTVFAEVRLRKSENFGGAVASVTTAKQQKLIATAQHYLGARRDLPACRFDVIALDQLDRARVEWIKDAFGT